MGQNARETKKAAQPVRIRLTQDLEERIDRAWKNGPHRDIDRQQFLLILLRRGVEAHDEDGFEERLGRLEKLVGEYSLSAETLERDPEDARVT